MASEPPWEKKKKEHPGHSLQKEKPKRPLLDFNAGKPDGGVKGPSGVALFAGFTDILSTQIVCDDAKSFAKAFKAITGAPKRDISNLQTFAGQSRASVTNSDGSIYMVVAGR